MKRLLAIGLLVSGVFAADFSQLSTEEMMNMRGSVPFEDRPAFREEMQKRMQSMTPEERQKYKPMGQGMGKNMGQCKGMGRGQNCFSNMPTFEEYDLNSDGKITQTELEEGREKRMKQKASEGKMLRNAGNAPAFSQMDKDNDGSLNLEEFQLHQSEQMNKWNSKNGMGNCPNKCFAKGKGMGQNRRNAPTFAEIDTNNDGVISQEEFAAHQSQRMPKN